MRKPLKNKKDKVPKITEDEYVKYLSSLKEREQVLTERVNRATKEPNHAPNLAISTQVQNSEV